MACDMVEGNSVTKMEDIIKDSGKIIEWMAGGSCITREED